MRGLVRRRSAGRWEQAGCAGAQAAGRAGAQALRLQGARCWADGHCRQLGAGAGRSERAGVRSRRGSGRQGVRAAGAQGGRRCWAGGALGAQALCARPCTVWAWPGRGLVRWMGQLGAHAASLVFDLGF